MGKKKERENNQKTEKKNGKTNIIIDLNHMLEMGLRDYVVIGDLLLWTKRAKSTAGPN
jgi:hypothetical protein